ncbi:MAG: glutaredoxin domain-containing protein [Pseudomonadota bacterium]|nr:glutaredoxin domain-containing protein [Pseudomonadota bacterium]
MDNIIYSKDNCPYCVMAKRLLEQHKISFTEINISHVDNPHEVLREIASLTSKKTFPQIVLSKQHIGGYDDLRAHFLNISSQQA